MRLASITLGLGCLFWNALGCGAGEPVDPRCESCEEEGPPGKADETAVDWNAPIRNDDSPPVFMRVHTPFEMVKRESGLFVSPLIRDGRFEDAGTKGAYPSCHFLGVRAARVGTGTVIRLANVEAFRELGLVEFSLRSNSGGLLYLSCDQGGEGTFSYADIARHFFNRNGDPAIAILEPLSDVDRGSSDRVRTERPLTQLDAAAECELAGRRLPTSEEYRWLADVLPLEALPGMCLWSQDWAHDQHAELARVSEDGTSFAFETAPIGEATCYGLCARGLLSVIDWGEHRSTIETVLRERVWPWLELDQPRPDVWVNGGERLIEAERVLKDDHGFDHVVRAAIESPSDDGRVQLDIVYANAATDRCARVRVRAYAFGGAYIVDEVSTELDTPCPSE